MRLRIAVQLELRKRAMKKIELNGAVAVAVIVVTGAACAAAGAYLGYEKGYKQGDFAGRHEASRSAVGAVTELMTSGFGIKQADGSGKTFVLKPVESTKN